MTGVQLDLEGRVLAAARLAELVAAYHAAMREDWRNPGSHTVLRYPKDNEAVGGQVWSREGTRCGRCGTACAPYDMIISHDLGYCGCPRDKARYGGAFQYLPTHAETVAALNDREDRAVFPDCARCGHAWGLHNTHRATLPALTSCYVYCGCDGYVPPPMAATPWGTCPGCWAPPHDGPCEVTCSPAGR